MAATKRPKPGSELETYERKRDFEHTPEPRGARSKERPKRRTKRDAPAFVVHEHHARALHWDLRLEHDGALASWAIPKGLPPDPRVNHLAVHTEDHPMEYLDFAGEIPAGNYGAGTMKVWDTGTYDPIKFDDREVMVVLHGDRVDARYVLFRTRGNDWMIHRMDPPAGGDRELMPESVEPMDPMPTAKLPSKRTRYRYEVKWDGLRAFAFVAGGRVRLQGRDGTDLTGRFPELRGMGLQLGVTQVVLDGEIVASPEPTLAALQARLHASGRAVPRLQKTNPVAFAAFDVLWLDGRTVTALPWSERRQLLEELELDGPNWQTPPAADDGRSVLDTTRAAGWEGVVAKRIDAPYTAGRSDAWLKLEHRPSQQFVVGGVTPECLLVGYWSEGKLRYAGPVAGTLQVTVTGRRSSPFATKVTERDVTWVNPDVVIEVTYESWPARGRLRGAHLRAVSADRDPSEIGREPST